MKTVQIGKFIVNQAEPPSRDNSFIAFEDLAEHCSEFWAKVYEIESNNEPDDSFNNKYCHSQLKFVRTVLDFLDDWSFISWKQYDSIMRMKRGDHYVRRYYVIKNNSLADLRRHLAIMDIGMEAYDTDDGCITKKRDDGTYYRAYPTDDELHTIWLEATTDRETYKTLCRAFRM